MPPPDRYSRYSQGGMKAPPQSHGASEAGACLTGALAAAPEPFRARSREPAMMRGDVGRGPSPTAPPPPVAVHKVPLEQTLPVSRTTGLGSGTALVRDSDFPAAPVIPCPSPRLVAGRGCALLVPRGEAGAWVGLCSGLQVL